ncbi:MAG TPA: TolC family protein [Verrucomicrobiae bacterium]|nr:TolC family protein [Verrucomicrobiae bacterium]
MKTIQFARGLIGAVPQSNILSQVLALFCSVLVTFRTSAEEPKVALPPPPRQTNQSAAVSHPLATIDTNRTLRLMEVVSEVLAENPSIKAARANWESMRERIPQARAWEDPRLGVDVERYGTSRFADYSDAEWMVSQMIPLSGKNRRRARVAQTEAQIAFQEVRKRELDLTTRARLAYFDYVNAAEQIAINAKNISLVRQFAEISRSKYETGNKPQTDLLAAETEAARMEEAQVDLSRMVGDAQSQLNVLMNHPVVSPLGRPLMATSAPPQLDLSALMILALSNRPELESNRRKVLAANERITLAKRNWIPDPELRLEARQLKSAGGRFEEYDTGIFITVPWLNRSKYKAAIREAETSRESAHYELAAIESELFGTVRVQVRKIETLHHHLEIYRSRILPLARQTVDSARISYESDKSSFLDLITAQRGLQEAESMYWHHATEYEKALAELDALIGNSPFPNPITK